MVDDRYSTDRNLDRGERSVVNTSTFIRQDPIHKASDLEIKMREKMLNYAQIDRKCSYICTLLLKAIPDLTVGRSGLDEATFRPVRQIGTEYEKCLCQVFPIVNHPISTLLYLFCG